MTLEFCGVVVTGQIPGFCFVPQFVFLVEEQGNCADVYQVVHRYLNEQVTGKKMQIELSQNLHQPLANLSTYQKGAYYYGIKVFNSLLHK